MKLQPTVTIIIVTWNKKDDVLNLLDALHGQRYGNFRVVVVDNASTDNTAEAVRNHPLALTLLENQDNLGGTGGFNTGLRYALHCLEQDFIWLLDNDAMVNPETLVHLVDAMESNPDVGVAGSRIMAPEREGFIVEVGGSIDWNQAIWKPNSRYQLEKNENQGSLVDVDYVAACSALVRDSALREVGIMDERFFLHWDDIDFCLRFKEQGFRVIAVYDSVIFHSVEKGFNPNIIYFDIRNGLLMAAKHRPLISRLAPQWALSRFLGIGWVSSLIDKRKRLAKTFRLALQDALFGKYGGFSPPPADAPRKPCQTSKLPSKIAKILIIANGPFQQVCSAAELARGQWPQSRVDLMVQSDRAKLLEHLCPDGEIFTYDLRRDGLFEKAKMGILLMNAGYDLAIEVDDDFLFPYRAFLKRVALIRSEGEFVFLQSGFTTLIQLPFILVAGGLLAACIFPLTILQGVLHDRKP